VNNINQQHSGLIVNDVLAFPSSLGTPPRLLSPSSINNEVTDNCYPSSVLMGGGGGSGAASSTCTPPPANFSYCSPTSMYHQQLVERSNTQHSSSPYYY
jgi:hypothetical protein